jgi:uncharacterized membrane protein
LFEELRLHRESHREKIENHREKKIDKLSVALILNSVALCVTSFSKNISKENSEIYTKSWLKLKT